MAHKTRIDLAAREIIGGRCMENNAARNIVKGRTLVNNAYRDIFFGIPIGTLDVGETVLMDIDGKETEFLVVNQGNPDGSVYDASCDGTWLLAKNILERRIVEAISSPYYSGSNIHEYLNGDFLNLLGDRVRDAITMAKIPYFVDTDTVANGAEGLSCKIFLLSYAELNASITGVSTKEGHNLSYFDTAYSVKPGTNTHLIATLDGIAESWMVRTVGSAPVHYCAISSTGDWANLSAGRTTGIRPAMIMPFDTRVTNTRHEIMG